MKKIIKNPLFWVVVVFLVSSAIYLYNVDESVFFVDKDVAMEVNGMQFSVYEFNQMADQITQEYAMYGMILSEEEIKEEVVDRLVQQALLMQLAEEKGIEISAEELEEYFQEIMAMYGMSEEEEFLKQLEEEGFSDRAEIDKILTSEIRINKILDHFAEDIDITQEEIEEAYNQFVQQVEEVGGVEQIPTLEEREDEIRQSLMEEKVSPVVLAKLEEMREDAEVKIYIEKEELVVEEAPVQEESFDFEEMEIELENLENLE
jgi:FKBP-type peptidyl-prolyl cis-trans isomerase (trigger factor)